MELKLLVQPPQPAIASGVVIVDLASAVLIYWDVVPCVHMRVEVHAHHGRQMVLHAPPLFRLVHGRPLVPAFGRPSEEAGNH